MSPERYFPAEEDITLDKNSEKLDLVIKSFEYKLAKVINGEDAASILFEGDFVLSQKTSNGFHIDIGSGYTIDSATLATRFLREMGKKGRISSTDFKAFESSIKGDTDASSYYRSKNLFTKTFPVERIIYRLDVPKGFDLVVYKDRFFDRFFQGGKKGNPILERWYTQIAIFGNQPIDFL
jgi:hypothetical protein